jgi:SAM-dependent methyltransferase
MKVTNYASAAEAARACSLDGPVVDVIQGRAFDRTEVAGCPLCGARCSSRLTPAGFGMQAVVAECRPCRIAYQSLRPSPEATLAYMNWRWASADTYVADVEDQLRRGRRQVGIVKEHLEPASLLDFGAGSGAFVRAALDAGWRAEGVERSGVAVANARERFGVTLQSAPGIGYDAVTLWDVVEHLRDPQGTLADLRRRMKPGGRVFLETGNWESWTRLEQGYRWGLILLDHQYYFTPTSLEGLLLNAGFRDFKLLDLNRSRLQSDSAGWRYWLLAKARWNHGDITIMIATAAA